MPWSWDDYKLITEPTFDIRDTTFIALGRNDELEGAMRRFKLNAQKGIRELLRLDELWGAGKSTFCYNLCYQMNEHLFFGDELEEPELRGKSYTHVLAIYAPRPARLGALMDTTCIEGLPFPWRGKEGKVGIDLKRKDLWRRCVRKLCFIALLKAIHTIPKKELVERAVGETVDRKAILEQILKLKNLKTKQFIEEIDKLGAKNEDTYEVLENISRYYVSSIMSPIDIIRHIRHHTLVELFPLLIWPLPSEKYSNGYRSLFNVPYGRKLNYLPGFYRLSKDVGVFLNVVIDEMERLPLLTISVDSDLHELATNSVVYSSMTILLIFRQELTPFLKRSEKRLHIYQTVYDGLVNFPFGKKITDPEKFQNLVIGVTKEILDIWRLSGEPSSTFPFTESLIKKIATDPSIFGFVRRYIKAMLDVLKWSLGHDRPKVELTEGLYNIPEVQSMLSGIKAAEEEEAKRLPVA